MSTRAKRGDPTPADFFTNDIRQLRQVHPTRFGDPGGQAPGAVVGEQAQQLGDRHVGAVFLHQAADAGLAVARTEVTGDVDGGQVLGATSPGRMAP